MAWYDTGLEFVNKYVDYNINQKTLDREERLADKAREYDLAVKAIQNESVNKQPVLLSTPSTDTVKPNYVMYIALTIGAVALAVYAFK